jgi:hypothetical protein
MRTAVPERVGPAVRSADDTDLAPADSSDEPAVALEIREGAELVPVLHG